MSRLQRLERIAGVKRSIGVIIVRSKEEAQAARKKHYPKVPKIIIDNIGHDRNIEQASGTK